MLMTELPDIALRYDAAVAVDVGIERAAWAAVTHPLDLCVEQRALHWRGSQLRFETTSGESGVGPMIGRNDERHHLLKRHMQSGEIVAA